MRDSRTLASPELIHAAKAYDYEHKPTYGSWQAVTDKQAERIVVGYLLALAQRHLMLDNAPEGAVL
jgi:hypothetical protein